MPFTNRKFGIEIEGFGLTERQIFDVFAGINIPINLPNEDYDGDNPPTPNSWETKRDCSVRDNSGHETSDCFEIISPPLSGETGLFQVQTVTRALRAAGARTNKTCGLHVHIDASELKAIDLANIVIQYSRHEPAIDNFMPASRRNNSYCLSGRHEADNMLRDIARIASENNIGNLIENYACDRFRKVNLDAYLRHGTVEFRQHSGSVNEEKIMNWIRFCVNFVEQCKIPEHNIVINPVINTPPIVQNTDTIPAITYSGRLSPYAFSILNALNSSINIPLSIEQLGFAGNIDASRVSRIISEIRQTCRLTTQQLPHRGNTYFLRGIRLVEFSRRNENVNRIRSVRLTELETPFTGLTVEIATFYQERAMEFAVR